MCAMASPSALSRAASASRHSLHPVAEQKQPVADSLTRHVLEQLDAIYQAQTAMKTQFACSFGRLEQAIEMAGIGHARSPRGEKRRSASTESIASGSTRTRSLPQRGVLPHRSVTLTRSHVGDQQPLDLEEVAPVLSPRGFPRCKCNSTHSQLSAPKANAAEDLQDLSIEDGPCLAGVPFLPPIRGEIPAEKKLLPSQPSSEIYCGAVTSKAKRGDLLGEGSHRLSSQPLPTLLGGCNLKEYGTASPRSLHSHSVSWSEDAASVESSTADSAKQLLQLRASEHQVNGTHEELTSDVASDAALSGSVEEDNRDPTGSLLSKVSGDFCAFTSSKETPKSATMSSAAVSTRTVSSRAEIRKSGTLVFNGDRPNRLRDAATTLVRRPLFGYLVCVLLLANAFTIGMEVNYMASNIGQSVPNFFRVTELVFCLLFAAELGLRGYVHGSALFRMQGWQWNVFEVLVVVLQVAEMLVDAAMNLQGTSISSISNLARIFQLLRIVRVLRIVHFVRDLDKLVYLIIASWQYFLWTVALLMLLTYMLGVFITQLVVEHGESHPKMVAPGTQLHQYFGSIGISVLSLFQAISGGVEWGELVTPLTESISSALAPLVSLYVAFAVLVILNLVTGVYVEGAQNLTKEDRDNDLLHKVREMFNQTDSDDRGLVTWGEFRQQLDNPNMKKLLADIGLGLCKPEDFFWVLDREHRGQISADEFVCGGVVLGQPARAIDVALLLHNNSQTTLWLRRQIKILETHILQIVKSMAHLKDGSDSPQTSRRSSLASIGQSGDCTESVYW